MINKFKIFFLFIPFDLYKTISNNINISIHSNHSDVENNHHLLTTPQTYTANIYNIQQHYIQIGFISFIYFFILNGIFI